MRALRGERPRVPVSWRRARRPGKYDTNTSRISEASGHNSSFKPPTERPKLRGLSSGYAGGGETETPTRSKRGGSAKGKKSGDKKAA